MALLPPQPNMTIKGKGLEDLAKEIRLLATVEVLIGIPEEKTDREPDEDDKSGLTNAALLYIHENGMPEQNIPERPSLGPAIAENTDEIERALKGIARRVLMGNPKAVEMGYHTLGMKMASAVKNKINDGIGPGLADSTLAARARSNKVTKSGRKGARAEIERRALGGRRNDQAGMDLAKPLVMTAQLRNAVTYAIRQKERS